ncbi:hypothetical protein ABTN03_18650, partial [Acinetobacter baumannii]
VVGGQSPLRIIFRQILPNAFSPIIVTGSLMVASAILLESALSFLGLGDREFVTWGFMIGAGRTMIDHHYPLMDAIRRKDGPAAAIAIQADILLASGPIL